MQVKNRVRNVDFSLKRRSCPKTYDVDTKDA